MKYDENNAKGDRAVGAGPRACPGADATHLRGACGEQGRHGDLPLHDAPAFLLYPAQCISAADLGRLSPVEVRLRVIAGAARGITLLAPPGTATRPTSDLLRGAIFNMLAIEGPFERVADLYAGSGALGIEALSRGAEFAAFIEQNPRACRVIQRNLEAAKCADRAQVICASLPAGLHRLAGAYDLLLLDPPYDAGELPRVLAQLAASDHLSPGAFIVAEHRATTTLLDDIGSLTIWKHRRQGDGAVTFYHHGPLVALPQ
ncbi:MAG: 16S rRNA (guanine(966)-N(2))-methyltransferase RsmD [Chloroflexota bacterium]